ncbi:MAG: M6 family metalloprotease domain-containing protein, partial [Muribaculaceae bacterium]|nr:M6 family metalloprotease domain-containing protein [Muribaculaceae bacterium]
NDGDGECDVLIILYAGDGEASSMDSDAENAIWPCQWQLSYSDYGKALTLDQTRVDKFACFNELNGTNLKKIDGIGTFCHEFSHCLGLPDFYDTEYGPHFGMGPWSLMDYGSYNNDSYTPIGYSAYEKEFMGWIEIEEGVDNTLYSMPIFNSKNLEDDKAVKLTNPKDANEYFIIENRQQQGWDAYMPAQGLMIYHVTYDASAWTGNTVNNYSLQRMTPVPCDNNLKLDSQSYWGETYYSINQADLLGDLWPYKGNNEFTNNSLPAQKLNSGGYLGKPVTEITQNSDGTISFWLNKSDNPALSVPVFADHEIHSATSATIHWESDLENDATFNLEVKERSSNPSDLVSSTLFNSMDVFGAGKWNYAGYVAIEDVNGTKAARFGSSKQVGIITSPTFDGDSNGVVTVKLTSRQYNNDVASAKVELLDKNQNVLDEVSVPVDDKFREYAVKLNGKADATMFVRISNEANKKRIFVSKVGIYNGDATEEEDTRAGKLDSRMITGIEGTSYTLTDLKPGVFYDYRIKAVPRDAYSFNESAWSEKKELDLTSVNMSAIDEIVTENEIVEYFTLQGMKISKPTVPGIYIRKSGKKTQKVSIR